MKTSKQSTRLVGENKKRFYLLMADFIGYIDTELDKLEDKDKYSRYKFIRYMTDDWGANWLLSQSKKDVEFLLTLDKLNSIAKYKYHYNYGRDTDLKAIKEASGGFSKLAEQIKEKIKKGEYPHFKKSLPSLVLEGNIDDQGYLSSESIYRAVINGSISKACKLTLNKYIHLVVTKSKGLALLRALECTSVTTTVKYKKLLLKRAKETSDQRLFRLLSKNIDEKSKAELFIHLYNDAVNKYNKKPKDLREQSSWYRSDLFQSKMMNLYYELSNSWGVRNCSDSKRKSLEIISKELGKILFSADWDDNKFLFMARLPYHTLYDIMFFYLTNIPKNKVKDTLANFYSDIITKREELYVTSTLNNPTLKEKNQIFFIETFLDKGKGYSRSISSNVIRDCIALYGKDEDFLFFIDYLKIDHKLELFQRSDSKWK